VRGHVRGMGVPRPAREKRGQKGGGGRAATTARQMVTSSIGMGGLDDVEGLQVNFG
jgi:hypothetical protein